MVNDKEIVLNDKYFFDNGYFIESWDNYARHRFQTVQTTEKWSRLVHQCLNHCRLIADQEIVHTIITEDLLLKILLEGPSKRKQIRRRIIRPKDYLTTAERKSIAKAKAKLKAKLKIKTKGKLKGFDVNR